MTIGTSPVGADSIGSVGGVLEIIPVGIASTLVFGMPSLVDNIEVTGIASTITFGVASLGFGLNITGISSGIVFGSHAVTPPDQQLFPTGIAATSIIGSFTIVSGGATIINVSSIGPLVSIGNLHIFDAPEYIDIDPNVTTLYEDIPT